MTYTTILVNLEAGRSNRDLLAAAEILAERFHSVVIGSTACTPIQMLYGDGTVSGEIFEQDRLEITREIAKAEAEFRDAMGRSGRVLVWRSAVLVASLSLHLVAQARAADLVLIASPTERPANAARQINPGDVVMHAGRPVMVASPTHPLRLDRIMIAWKDTREARRVTADALPLLKRAAHVSLVEITDADDRPSARRRLADVAAWLSRHGVVAHIETRSFAEDDDAQVKSIAGELSADIIVAGAYGHSRVREWALGGVTRRLLKPGARASVVSH